MRMSSFKMVFHWNPPSHRNLSIPTWCRHVRGFTGVQLDQNKPVEFFFSLRSFRAKKKAGVQSHGVATGVGDPTFRPGDFSPRWLNTNPFYEILHIETNALLFWGKRKQGELSATSNGYHGGFPMNQFSAHWEILLVPGGGIIHIWNSSESPPPFTGSLGQIIDSTSLPLKEGIWY